MANITGAFAGTYTNDDSIELTFTGETPDGFLSATWKDTNNGVLATWMLSGSYVAWSTIHNRWLFGLSGWVESTNPDWDPAFRYSMVTVVGYGDGGSSTSLPDTLQITYAWAEDRSGNSEETDGVIKSAFTLQT